MSGPISDLQLFADLDAVEEVLLRDGWTKRTEFDPVTGARCVRGAAKYVLSGAVRRSERYLAIRRALGGVRVPDFNDHPETTFDDVLARLRAARDALIAP